MTWNRTASQKSKQLKELRDKAILARYTQLCELYKHKAARINIMEQEFYLTKQRINQILKSNNVYNYEQNSSIRQHQC